MIVSNDSQIQAIIIAFIFASFIEGAIGLEIDVSGKFQIIVSNV